MGTWISCIDKRDSVGRILSGNEKWWSPRLDLQRIGRCPGDVIYRYNVIIRLISGYKAAWSGTIPLVDGQKFTDGTPVIMIFIRAHRILLGKMA